MARIAVALATLAAIAISTATAETVTVFASMDTTICASDNGDQLANALGDGIYVGQTGQQLARRGLIHFNLSEITSGSMISSVRIELYDRNFAQDEEFAISVHRVLQPWQEGTSTFPGGKCAKAGGNDASWKYSNVATNTTWRTVGGNYTVEKSALTSVGSSESYYIWQDERLVRDVQAWIDDPASNYGWILIGDEETVRSVKSFVSRQNMDTTAHPRIVIEYTRSSKSTTERDVGIAVGVCVGVIIVIIAAVLLLKRRGGKLSTRHTPIARQDYLERSGSRDD
eukprot:m.48097 g.48097  ORF g.48097 m.48097 type:complete len:284 (-) comp12379_c0_seq1:115-966(-)